LHACRSTLEDPPEIARRLGVGLIATNDVHYLSHDDVQAHDVLCCISTGKKLDDPDRFRFETDQFYLKTPQQMRQLFSAYPEAVSNTLRVAELCNVELDFTQVHTPLYTPPGGRRPEEFLRELVYEGARRRYPEGTELEFVIMVIAVSCVKLLSAHNSTQHTSRKHKV
jgi:DNA polymerase III catalytic subunit, DnaE type